MTQSQPMRAAEGCPLGQVSCCVACSVGRMGDWNCWCPPLPLCRQCPPENGAHTGKRRQRQSSCQHSLSPWIQLFLKAELSWDTALLKAENHCLCSRYN